MYGRNERRRAESNTVEKCSKALQIKRRERWSDGVMGSPITPQPHYSNTPVVRGDIDLTDSNIPTMLNLKAAGILDVRCIAVWMNRITLSFIARKGIKTPADLKGKQLAISRYGSSSDFVTRMLLRYWKLDPE